MPCMARTPPAKEKFNSKLPQQHQQVLQHATCSLSNSFLSCSSSPAFEPDALCARSAKYAADLKQCFRRSATHFRDVPANASRVRARKTCLQAVPRFINDGNGLAVQTCEEVDKNPTAQGHGLKAPHFPSLVGSNAGHIPLQLVSLWFAQAKVIQKPLSVS